MLLRIPLKPLFWTLAISLVLLVVVGTWLHLAAHADQVDWENRWLYQFNLSGESNVPTWYSSSLLLLCSMVLLAIGGSRRQQQREWVRHWLLLGFVFLYMSLDEAVMIHEYASLWFDTGGIFFFGWVIPAGILVFVMGFSYVGFISALPVRSRVRFVMAGALYVGGALGVELGLGYWSDLSGSDNPAYVAIDALEEGMEIAGLSLFLFSLLDYAGGERGVLELSFVGLAEGPTDGTERAASADEEDELPV